MPRLTSAPRESPPRSSDDARRGRLALLRRDHDDGSPVPWVIARAVVLGLRYLAWSYIGPNVRRCARIQSM